MQTNYRKITQKELLTRIYSDVIFRNNYFKWLRIGNYPFAKRGVNSVVVEYEDHLYAKLNASWWGRLFNSDIDLVHYRGHSKEIPMFLEAKANV